MTSTLIPSKITLVTGNAGKCKEFTEIFTSLGFSVQFDNVKIDLDELQLRTSGEVSIAKMSELLTKHGVDPDGCYIVEDTSLVVLDPEDPESRIPGPFIKFFGTKKGDFEKLVRLFPGKEVIAEAIITFYYARQARQFVGDVSGNIVTGRLPSDLSRGDNGFGWDKQFVLSSRDMACLSDDDRAELAQKYPTNSGYTLAQLSDTMKSKISHRRRAIEKLATYLKSLTC